MTITDSDGNHIDLVAIDQALAGQRVTLTHPERKQAAHIAKRRGLTMTQTARLLHVSGNTIQRLWKATP